MSIQSIPALFPQVMTPTDLVTMSRAFHLAQEEQSALQQPVEDDVLARNVYRLYADGLTDLKKLATLAQLMATSPNLKIGSASYS